LKALVAEDIAGNLKLLEDILTFQENIRELKNFNLTNGKL
jgi:hypothetical protein